MLKISSKLYDEVREKLIELFSASKDVFAWSHENMPVIEPTMASYELNIDIDMRPIKQKKRTFNPKQYQVMGKQVKKLLKTSVIEEFNYPEWLVNVVLVKRSNG